MEDTPHLNTTKELKDYMDSKISKSNANLDQTKFIKKNLK